MVEDIFGYSSSTHDNTSSLANYIRYIYAVPSYDGTLGYFYCWGANFSIYDVARAAVYVSSTRALVAQTEEFSGQTALEHLISGAFGPSSVVAGVTYIIVAWGDANDKGVYRHNFTPTDGYWYDSSRIYANSGNGDFGTYLNPLDAQSNYIHFTTAKSIFFISYDVTMGGEGYTSFMLPVGNYQEWIWNSGQYNADMSIQATDKSGTDWIWAPISSSINYYYPSGSGSNWAWVSGSTT